MPRAVQAFCSSAVKMFEALNLAHVSRTAQPHVSFVGLAGLAQQRSEAHDKCNGDFLSGTVAGESP